MICFVSPNIDLHVHSTFSDGLLGPGQVVELAFQKKIMAIAITDHDEIAGYKAAYEAGKSLGIEVLSGIEISTLDQGMDIHVLGYCLDPHNSEIQDYIQAFKKKRVERAVQIVNRLGEMGIRISFELVKMKANSGSIGRPHIADVLVEEGFVFSFQEAFQKYLADDKPAYVPKAKIESQDAIRMIHNAGGLAFIAHPAIGVSDELIERFVNFGLDGIETLHPKHTPKDIQHYQELCRQYCLLESGGSDCHGARQGEAMLGCMKVPYSFLLALKKRCRSSAIEASV